MKKIAIMAAVAALAMAFGANAQKNLKAKLDKYPEIREAICTVGVETLEDNAINFDTLKQMVKEGHAAKMVMGLKAIKDHLNKGAGTPAETGTPAMPTTPGNPATPGVQVQ